ncbi:hypothetical protein AVEN_81497-1 [Araneus ventricosus]|uniref:Transposase Tc1-like domain-containing protein n=1 Tax=Araneus ventricosus TaxID=182803 RepID=A0A4Y2E0Q3_ARAVE|nr:hypothetical protein AVEN_81497-1 [Araneus ventricosus]
MGYPDHLGVELRWRAVRELVDDQSQAEVTRWLRVSRIVVSRLWNQFQTTDTFTRKVFQTRSRAMTTADDRYVALNAQRHRELTAE